jgi:selenocysteine-specific elongation factor
LINDVCLGQLSERVKCFVSDFHAQHPETLGPSLHRVQRTFGKAMVDQIWAELLTYLEARGLVGRKSGFLFIPSHHQSLKSSDEQVAQKVYPLILEGRFDPPWVRDLATQTGSGELQMRLSLQRLASAGELYQVVKDLFYHPSVIQELAKIAISVAQTQAPGEPLSKARITAAQFRDATGLGRKRAIQILEFFDKIGFTRRIEDTHLIRGNTDFFK